MSSSHKNKRLDDLKALGKGVASGAQTVATGAQNVASEVGQMVQRRRDVRLRNAIQHNKSRDEVISALQAGGNPNQLVPLKDTAGTLIRHLPLLECAVNWHAWETVNHLLDAGADYTRLFDDGRSILMHASHALYYKNCQQAFQKLLDLGADINHTMGEEHIRPNLAFTMVSGSYANGLLKQLLRKGVDISQVNQAGQLADETATRSNQFPAVAAIRLYREAPMLPAGKITEALTRESVMQTNDQFGRSLLDHWDTWDRLDAVQKVLTKNGETLNARDLLQPMAGFTDESGEPLLRLHVLLSISPEFAEKLFDPSLWQNETPATAREFVRQLPEELAGEAPLHRLVADLARKQRHVCADDRQQVSSGRGGR